MSLGKPSPIEIDSRNGDGARLELIGYPKEEGYTDPYIRIETLSGIFLGVVGKRQLRRLKEWCEAGLGERAVLTKRSRNRG